MPHITFDLRQRDPPDIPGLHNKTRYRKGGPGSGSPPQSPEHPLRLPSTPLRSAQGDLSKTSLPLGPHPERGPAARGHGPNRGVGIIDMRLGVKGMRLGHPGRGGWVSLPIIPGV
jgi:hypothetical protein